MKEHEFETLQEYLQQGGSIKMLGDIDQQDLDLLSRYGSQLMNYGDYEGAKRIFYLLMRVDQWNSDYFFALGTCCQQLKQHEEAIFCFSRAGIINIEDPRGPYYAGKSYLEVGNIDYAAKSFQAAIRVCNCHSDNNWDEIAQLAKQALAPLLKEVQDV